MTQHTTAQLSALSTFRDEVLSWIKATGNQNEKDVDSYIENAARHLGDFSDEDKKTIIAETREVALSPDIEATLDDLKEDGT